MTPIRDSLPILFADFNMDINKIEAVITSLDRKDLLNKVNQSGVPLSYIDNRNF